jgi:hypothetical protein
VGKHYNFIIGSEIEVRIRNFELAIPVKADDPALVGQL